VALPRLECPPGIHAGGRRVQSHSTGLNYLILAQTGCDCKFNIEAQRGYFLFLPAAIAAAKKFEPPASRVVVESETERFRHCNKNSGAGKVLW
jgi:hypothetical protein